MGKTCTPTHAHVLARAQPPFSYTPPLSLSLSLPRTLPHGFDSDLTIRAALVFQGDRGPWLRPVWLRAKAPLWTDARGIQSTHWPRIVWSQVTVSLGQQLKDAGSVGPLLGGRVHFSFELCPKL